MRKRNLQVIVSDFVIGTSTGAKPATASITPADLYFESIGEKYDEEQLEELFVRFGNINSWEMINMRDKTERSRKVGFVSYELHEFAALFTKELNGKVTV